MRESLWRRIAKESQHLTAHMTLKTNFTTFSAGSTCCKPASKLRVEPRILERLLFLRAICLPQFVLVELFLVVLASCREQQPLRQKNKRTKLEIKQRMCLLLQVLSIGSKCLSFCCLISSYSYVQRPMRMDLYLQRLHVTCVLACTRA